MKILNRTEVIELKVGKLQGYINEGISIFKGIPFAEPPIGELRLRAPILKNSWDGILESFNYKPVAPQTPPYRHDFPPPPQSEADCLNLNIWSPGCDENMRPVMFWIHGGAHRTGSGRLMDGKVLSRRGDIVLVSINYRLSMLGYPYLPGVPANIGQLDQIAALRWVHDNIEAFGGDPNNVTIFGESAGGTSVCALMAMPKAKGLFHRAICQSGGVTPIGLKLSERKKTTELVLEELNLTLDDVDKLRNLPVENIIEAMTKASVKAKIALGFKPYIDGENLPKHPIKAIEEGFAKDIELIIGTNLEEWRFWRAFEPKFEEYEPSVFKRRIEDILKSYGIKENMTEDLIKIYKKSRYENNMSTNLAEIFEACKTDSAFRFPSITFAEAQSRHQENTYMYLFKWKTPYQNGRFGAMHALDVPFVFGSFLEDYLFIFPKKTPETEELSNKMSDYWASFARTGIPNPRNILKWPSYKKSSRKTMIFDNNTEIIEDPLNLEREAWDEMKIWSGI